MTTQQKRAVEAYREMLVIGSELDWRRRASRCSSPRVITLALIAGTLAVCGILGVLIG